jgi:hypothetical protein
MRSIRLVMATTGFTALVACASHGQVAYFKKEPPVGELPYGKIVYVDDGACPGGEIKEVTGGTREEGIPQEVRCIKRPR